MTGAESGFEPGDDVDVTTSIQDKTVEIRTFLCSKMLKVKSLPIRQNDLFPEYKRVTFMSHSTAGAADMVFEGGEESLKDSLLLACEQQSFAFAT